MQMTLSSAATEILKNDGKAPREIRRVSVAGRRVWTADGRCEHGVKGQRGYEVDGVLYARARDIVRHADEALSPIVDRHGRHIEDDEMYDEIV